MIEHTPELDKLTAALAKVQSQVSGVEKDSTNPHFRNRYASLEAVIGAVRIPLTANGVVFTQAPGAIVGGAVEITTMLIHTSGQWLRSTLHVPLERTNAQGVGSAITYGCRYALMATLGLPPLDDDAEGSVSRPPVKREAIVTEASQPQLISEPHAGQLATQLQEKIAGCVTIDELDAFIRTDHFKIGFGSLPTKHRAHVQMAGQKRRETLAKRDAA